MKIKLHHHIHRPYRSMGGRPGKSKPASGGVKNHFRLGPVENRDQALHTLEELFGIGGDGFNSLNPEIAVY